MLWWGLGAKAYYATHFCLSQFQMVTIASEPSETVTRSFSFSGQKAADVNFRERSSVEQRIRRFLMGTSYTMRFFFSRIVCKK